jgi:Domain of unknown function (DUF4234)
MKQRKPAAVFFLSLITFGIYTIVWHVKTKNELNRFGATIPTAWLLIVPLANLYWIWRYAEGVEQVSKGQISAVMALILLLLLSIVGIAILQSEFNKLNLAIAPVSPNGDGLSATPSPAVTPPAPIVPQPPVPPTTIPPSPPPTVIQ